MPENEKCVPNLTNTMEIIKNKMAELQGHLYYLHENFNPEGAENLMDEINLAHQKLMEAQNHCNFVYSELTKPEPTS